MNISDFTIKDNTVKVQSEGKEYHIYKTLDADQVIGIILETVTPLFVDYRVKGGGIGNIIETPSRKEKFLAMNQPICFATAVVKYATDIEFDLEDTYEIYNIIISNGIFEQVMEVLRDSAQLSSIVDTIDKIIFYRLKQKLKR